MRTIDGVFDFPGVLEFKNKGLQCGSGKGYHFIPAGVETNLCQPFRSLSLPEFGPLHATWQLRKSLLHRGALGLTSVP